MADPFNVSRSPYLDRSRLGGGGSAYADTSRLPSGDPFRVSRSSGSGKSKKKHHGLLGALEHVAHATAESLGRSAHTAKSIPGGVIDTLEAAAEPFGHPLRLDPSVKRQWSLLLHGHILASLREAEHSKNPKAARLLEAQARGAVETLKRPGHDPLATVMLVAPALHGAGRVAEGSSAAARAVKAGEGVKAAARKAVAKPEVKPRLIRVGKARVPLHASENPGVRAVQRRYDQVIQKALDEHPEGKVAAHAARRVGGSIAETQRRRQGMRATSAGLVEHEAKRLSPSRGHVPGSGGKRGRLLEEHALRLTSENSTPEEAAAYHLSQAEKGVAVRANRRQALIYRQIARKGWLTRDVHGDVVVDAAKHPQLARVDAAVARAQEKVDAIAEKHGLMSGEQLVARRNGPARIRAGGRFVETPGVKGRAEQVRVYPKAGATTTTTGNFPAFTYKVEGPQLQRRLPGREAQRPSAGIVGGESARPGRGFVTYRTELPRAPKGGAASSAGQVVGAPRSFIPSKPFTGEGLAQAKIPDHTSRLVADHLRAALRFSNTSEFRGQVARTGSDLKRTSRDVLVLKPGVKAGKLTGEQRQAVGRTRSTLDTLGGEQDPATLRAHLERLVPGLRDSFAQDRAQGIGTKAPAGHVWVDRGVLGDLGKPGAGLRPLPARVADQINSAVTAATVYFKLGHVGTRVFTNAATNIIQGSAAPVEIAKSITLWRSLSHEDRIRALAAAGQHGFQALPHEGASPISQAARVGAEWWARHADAPFRFNSIAFEARRAGIRTPEAFRGLLDQLENPEGLAPAEAARVEQIGKRSNREGIAYDRMNHFERNYITRVFWFYPWTKGAVSFLGNTILEHPYKAGVLGAAGVEGREAQQQELGDVPSYEGGLFKLAGDATDPLVADFSTFSPFATPADVLETVARPGEISGMLNPAYGAATQLITGENQFGGRSTSPISDALATLLAPTPEAQILQAYLDRHTDQSRRMFHKTVLNTLARAAAGPGLPRRVNLPAAHSSAARERSGR